MACWMADLSSGRGISKVERRARACAWVGRRFAGGVVVVAEVFGGRHGLPQRWPSVKMWRHW